MNADGNGQQSRHSWRLRVYPVALIGTLLGALLLATLVYDQDDPTSRLGGDYPAFYAAGSIALDGDWAELYSGERQQAEQAGLIDDEGGYLYFSYPPFVAAAYALFAGLEYHWSYLIHTILMGLALLASIKLMWPWLEQFGWPYIAVLALALACYPILRAVPGGQNTALSLLLLAAAARWDHDGKPLLAGLALALLLFKPQFGVVLVPLLLVGRRWRMLGGWAVGAVALFAWSTWLMGGVWVSDWWQQAGSFRELNVEANGLHFVSLPGFMENLVGLGSPVAWVIGYGLAAVVAVGVALYWWRNAETRPLERFALAAAVVVVAAPQTLYYDAGLLLLGLVAVLASARYRVPGLVAGLIVLSWIQVGAGSLGWSPLAPLVWAAVVLLASRLTAASSAEATPV